MTHKSAHATIALIEAMMKLNDIWQSRGYALEMKDGTWDITGDTTQFYLDAVANDANAAFGMAFLGQVNTRSYQSYCAETTDDMIDMEDTLSVYLHHKPLEDAMRAQNLLQ